MGEDETPNQCVDSTLRARNTLDMVSSSGRFLALHLFFLSPHPSSNSNLNVNTRVNVSLNLSLTAPVYTSTHPPWHGVSLRLG